MASDGSRHLQCSLWLSPCRYNTASTPLNRTLPMQLTSLTLSHASQLLSHEEISPVELVKSHLERIEQIDPKLNSFITVTAEAALQRADQAEQEMKREGWLPPLTGVPQIGRASCRERV